MGPALETDQFCCHVGELGFGGGALYESQYVGEHLVGVLAVGADAGDSQFSELPAIPLADLRRRHLELLADPSEQAAHDLPLGLQGTGIRQMKG